MLPGGSGIEILRQIRSRSDIPVIMLTAKGDESNRIEGLEIGADDYVPKPCNPRELSARLRAILRRGRNAEVTAAKLEVDDLLIDFETHKVIRDGEELDLTATEFNILGVLIREIGKVIDKNRLAEQSMQRSLTLFDRSLDMHLSNLRKKLGNAPDGNPRIKTIRGVGYMYMTNEASD